MTKDRTRDDTQHVGDFVVFHFANERTDGAWDGWMHFTRGATADDDLGPRIKVQGTYPTKEELIEAARRQARDLVARGAVG